MSPNPSASTSDASLTAHPSFAELHRILAGQTLTPLYQPIVDLNQRTLFGHEGLIRGPARSPLHQPLRLFAVAEQARHLAELDLSCRRTLIRRFGALAARGLLFLNVCPGVILERGYPASSTLRFLAEAGIGADTVVIELTEQQPIEDYDLMREAVAHYRRMGFKIALDDLGAGYAGLRGWSELRPDYVKIDHHFIRDVHEDDAKRQFVHSICEIARGLGCKVIAEGIETRDELDAVRSLGVQFAQGYYFGRPGGIPVAAIPHELFGTVRTGASPRTLTVASLVLERTPLAPQAALDEVIMRLRAEPEVGYLAVVDDGRPVGMVNRLRLMDLYTDRYARDLHGRKPIAAFMQAAPLAVPHDTLLTRLSRRVTGDTTLGLGEDFIITDERGAYLGMGTLLGLLRRITDLQIRHARYANPLTGLPGNVPINERVAERVAAGRTFTLLYCDIDNFKPYNDTYGYARGDDLIRHVAALIREHYATPVDFVGHVGGDDFVVVTEADDWQGRTEAMLEGFARSAARHYDAEHRAAGGVTTVDRRGNTAFFPIVTLSVGAVPVIAPCPLTHHEIAAIATEVTQEAKRLAGNVIFTNRRALYEPDQRGLARSA